MNVIVESGNSHSSSTTLCETAGLRDIETSIGFQEGERSVKTHKTVHRNVFQGASLTLCILMHNDHGA